MPNEFSTKYSLSFRVPGFVPRLSGAALNIMRSFVTNPYIKKYFFNTKCQSVSAVEEVRALERIQKAFPHFFFLIRCNDRCDSLLVLTTSEKHGSFQRKRPIDARLYPRMCKPGGFVWAEGSAPVAEGTNFKVGKSWSNRVHKRLTHPISSRARSETHKPELLCLPFLLSSFRFFRLLFALYTTF